MMRSLLLLALLGLSSLAVAASVNPERLKPVEGGQVYRLTQAWSFQLKAATFTVKAGEYRVRFQDAKAWYLLGETHCSEIYVVPPKQPELANTGFYDCGIYLPKNPAAQASFFWIRDKAPRFDEMGPIVNAIIKTGEGSYDFPTSPRGHPGLRELLVEVDAEG